MGGRAGRHVEIGVVVDDLPGLAALDDVHPHRSREIAPEVEEGHRKVARSVRPQGEVGLEADLAVGVVVDLRQDLRRRARRGGIGPGGAAARLGLQGLEGEGLRRAELQRGLGQGGRGKAGRGEPGRGGRGGEEETAVDHRVLLRAGALRRQSVQPPIVTVLGQAGEKGKAHLRRFPAALRHRPLRRGSPPQRLTRWLPGAESRPRAAPRARAPAGCRTGRGGRRRALRACRRARPRTMPAREPATC